jgi:UDP-3-O-[3-hydroxymyristoyl] glucosamine N-acyltransferase
MADPRFYDNRGPFRGSELCRIVQLDGDSVDGAALVHDVAPLDCAGPPHLTFCERRGHSFEIVTNAGWCIARPQAGVAPGGTTKLLRSNNVARAFATIATAFYPDHESGFPPQDRAVHQTAKIGQGVAIGPGAVVGADAQIGDGTRLGAHCVIGRGVVIGRSCEIGAHAVIGFAYLGDHVILQPGVVIGAAGFGYSSGSDGHMKIPQLGRVLIQDRVEIGANSAVDRAALGDTVIGEGTKIDNLVQIGHNTRIGRHCVIAGQVGISGSVVLGDFVAVGGKVGIADHVRIGDRARLAGLSGVTRDLDGGRDYGGIPARPVREWHREMAHLAKLARRSARSGDE